MSRTAEIPRAHIYICHNIFYYFYLRRDVSAGFRERFALAVCRRKEATTNDFRQTKGSHEFPSSLGHDPCVSTLFLQRHQPHTLFTCMQTCIHIYRLYFPARSESTSHASCIGDRAHFPHPHSLTRTLTLNLTLFGELLLVRARRAYG